MDTAFLFPGQGSQAVGMGRNWYLRFPQARMTFEEAEDILSFPLAQLCFEGPAEDLLLTENAQPALLTVSIAMARVLQEVLHLEPACAAGHSLGEFSALVCAQALDFPDALRVVRERGQAMQEAVPVGAGGMVAVFGLEAEQVSRLCTEVAKGEVLAPANLNGGGQVVVAGERSALERFTEAARSAGAKRVVALAVSAPFHCSLMAPAAERLRGVLESCRVRAPKFPVIANVHAQPYPSDPDAIRSLLCDQVTLPVQWERCMRAIVGFGAKSAIEVGPGRVLCNLAKRIAPGFPCTSADEQLAVGEGLRA